MSGGWKLVRDGYRDSTPETKTRPVADKTEHARGLRRKLLEEALELHEARGVDELTEEAGDVIEVVVCYLELHGVTLDEVWASVDRKKRRLGSFTDGTVWEYR